MIHVDGLDLSDWTVEMLQIAQEELHLDLAHEL